jgi:hypothetical protein
MPDLAAWLEWLVAVAAALAALGVIWTKGLRPLVHFFQRIADGVIYVQSQMINNGGSTIKDKVDGTARVVDQIVERLDSIDTRVELLEEVRRKQSEVERIVAENAERLAGRRPPLHLPDTKETP